MNLYDLVNEKNLVQNKEAALKFRTTFQIVRTYFMNSLGSEESCQYFEDLLINLPVEANLPKQTEVNFFNFQQFNSVSLN